MAGLDAVEFRHHHVEQDEVGGGGEGMFDCFASIGDGVDGIEAGQLVLEEPEHIGLVIGHEDAVLCAAGGKRVSVGCEDIGGEGDGGFGGCLFGQCGGIGGGEQFGAAVEVFEPFFIGRLVGGGCGCG